MRAIVVPRSCATCRKPLVTGERCWACYQSPRARWRSQAIQGMLMMVAFLGVVGLLTLLVVRLVLLVAHGV